MQQRAALPRARLFDILDSERLVVVRGARGSGKSALITSWIEHGGAKGRVVCRMRPPAPNTTADEYWSALIDKLRRSGVILSATDTTGDGSAFATLIRTLAQIDVDVLLVAEHPTRLDAVEIAGQFAQLATDCPRVHAVIETWHVLYGYVQLLTEGIAEIGPHDLRFTCDEVAELFANYGFQLTPEVVRSLRHTLGGEAFATDLALLMSKRLGYAAVDEFGDAAPELVAVLIDTVEQLLSRSSVTAWRAAILATAPARKLTNETAAVLGVTDAEELFETLERQGLLQRTSSDLAWEYPAALRFGLLELERRNDPSLGKQALIRLAEHSLAADDPTAALHYAVDARAWKRAGRILFAHYARIVDEDLGGLFRAVCMFPRSELARFPLVRAARFALTTCNESAIHSVELPESFEDLAALGASQDVAETVTMAITEAVALRRSAKFAEAVALSRRIEPILYGARDAGNEDVARRAPLIYLQTAVTYQLTGELADATSDFQVAFRDGHQFVRRQAAGGIALNWALCGDARRVRKWLDVENAQPFQDGEFGDFMRVAGRCAAVLYHLDQFDFVTADALLQGLGGPAFHDELWAFIAYARCQASLVTGRVDEPLSWVTRTIAEHRAHFAQSPFADDLLTAVQAELELAAGQANSADVRINATTSKHPVVVAARARTQLLTGRPEDAIATVTEIDWPASGYVRAHIDGLLIKAAAHLDLGDKPHAVASWRQACFLAEHSDCQLPFAFMALDRRTLLAEAADMPGPAVPAGSDIFPAAAPFVRLSVREREVLRLLAEGAAAHQIARKLFVSENTIKTQRRSIYKKLNAANRSQAVSTAQELRLLA
ncbi:LuxR C-terminal-related transcriptional regulator [Skermania sp. ID1734]|uniref:helix-turn-helix transcriptional regulator n=1 Tax=Skermania sp. ID1734 TaxID=2597516 RepID=UPI001C8FA197|nr:LuxR C-terminal-related transcriptional regulator [Skermania sp. ID1734]